MFKKLLSLTLICLLSQFVFARTAAANPKISKEARFAEKVKAGIARLGTGTEAKIEVKLKDKRKLKGYVSEAGDENFTVIDEKSGAATTVAYPQVKTAKGNNLSKGVVNAILVGGVVTLLVVGLLIATRSS